MEIGTHPDYHCRGLGTYLIKYGTDKADADGVVCYLSASPMGAALYRKMGWVGLDKLQISLSEYGGEGEHVHGK